MKELDHIPCYYIGRRLKWLGIQVTDMKEKYGSWRVYCHFSVGNIHELTHNGYHYVQYKGIWGDILYYRTYRAQRAVLDKLVNWWLVPLQKKWYRQVYKMALKRFPTEAEGLLMGADWTELLMGLDSRLKREQKEGCTYVSWKE